MRIIIPLVLLANISAHAVVVEKRVMGGRASHTIDDCRIFSYPDVISTTERLERLSSSRLQPAGEAAVASRLRGLASVEMERSVAVGDYLTFQDAILAFSDAKADGSDIAKNVLPLYFYAYGMDFHFPSELLIEGLRYSPAPSAFKGGVEPVDLPFMELAGAIYEAEAGKLNRAKALLDSFHPNTPLVSEQFQRAFLTYLVARESMSGIDEAINVLIEFEENEESICSPTLLGVVQLYKGELHEIAAERIPMPQTSDEGLLFRYRADVNERLHLAKLNFAESRRNIDMVYHPALWRSSVERAARLMGKMNRFKEDAPPHFQRRIEVLRATLNQYAQGRSVQYRPTLSPSIRRDTGCSVVPR